MTPEFEQGAAFVANESMIAPSDYADTIKLPVDVAGIQNDILHTDRFERLSASDCVDKYATDFVSDRRNLVLVSTNVSDDGSNNSLLLIAQYQYSNAVIGSIEKYLPFDW